MPLKSFNAGDAKLVSETSEERSWFLSTWYVRLKFVEVTTVVTHEWVALTQGAAEGAIPAVPADGESWIATEDNRIVGSYRLQRIVETKTLTTTVL